MEGIVSLLQSQFDYFTDSCHFGTKVSLFHVIIHNIQPYHIITINNLIIHFQQKHGRFPQLSYPISQQNRLCWWNRVKLHHRWLVDSMRWKPWQSWMRNVVLLHKVIFLKVTNDCLICWEKMSFRCLGLFFFAQKICDYCDWPDIEVFDI